MTELVLMLRYARRGLPERRRSRRDRPGPDLLTMSLETFWFIVVAFFWTGFFVLEGFDFGVGVLHTLVGRDDAAARR